jgi:hypothetical protein
MQRGASGEDEGSAVSGLNLVLSPDELAAFGMDAGVSMAADDVSGSRLTDVERAACSRCHRRYLRTALGSPSGVVRRCDRRPVAATVHVAFLGLVRRDRLVRCRRELYAE